MGWEQTGGLYMIQKSKLDEVYYNRYKLKGEYVFTEEFEVESYPFDLQDLSMVIAPETSSVEQQRLVPHHIIPSYFTINETWSSITDWQIVGLYCTQSIGIAMHLQMIQTIKDKKRVGSIIRFKLS